MSVPRKVNPNLF